jgi:hypothetical protein
MTLLLWASLQSGCFLLGYDGLGKTLDNDASADDSLGDAGTGGALRDGSLGQGGADSGGDGDDSSALDGGEGPDSGSNGDGDDAGSNDDAWWKETEPAVPCKGLIGSTACSQNCPATEDQCVFDCDVIGTCSTSCQAYTRCRSTCSSFASCGLTCASYADCSFESDATQVSATCEYGSSCDVTCPGNVLCDVTCKPGASCALHCKGVCNMNCTGVKRQCEDQSWVCDTKCPEDLSI